MERHLNLRIKNLGVKKYKKIKYPNIPTSSSDLYIITQMGDKVDTLAYNYYKDSSLWWIIVKANPDIIRRDSFYLEPGLEIRIPSNTRTIITTFERINAK